MEQLLPKLTGKQTRFLRSVGHSLKPILLIGKAGITESFITQVRTALETHELIKVKVGKTSSAVLADAITELTEKVPCQLAQSIGKTVLLYKARAEDPKIQLPEK
jgi:RNA-binding protein